MAERIEVVVTMKNIYSYERPAFGYGSETAYIYTMVDENENTYVWKTTAFMTEKFRDEENGWEIDTKGRKWNYRKIDRDDIIRIKASVKGHSEYKGQPQTELTRVKVAEVIFKAPTAEQIKKDRKAEQLASIKPEDEIWKMSYKRYKEHYSDCETMIDSFERDRNGYTTIKVIIRQGRMKKSGVRGESFAGYEMEWTENGQKFHSTFRAVSEENAVKQVKKLAKNAENIECVCIWGAKSSAKTIAKDVNPNAPKEEPKAPAVDFDEMMDEIYTMNGWD